MRYYVSETRLCFALTGHDTSNSKMMTSPFPFGAYRSIATAPLSWAPPSAPLRAPLPPSVLVLPNRHPLAALRSLTPRVPALSQWRLVCTAPAMCAGTPLQRRYPRKTAFMLSVVVQLQRKQTAGLYVRYSGSQAADAPGARRRSNSVFVHVAPSPKSQQQAEEASKWPQHCGRRAVEWDPA